MPVQESAVTLWAFTYFPDEDETPQDWLTYQWSSGAYTYLVGQVERAPDTGRFHIQGFAQTAQRKRLTQMKRLSDRAHWEKARDPNAARAYAMKEDTRVDGPWEYGAWKKAGRPATLEDACKLVLEGKTDEEIAKAAPMQFVRHYKGIAALRMAAKIGGPRREWAPELWVLWGPSGTGKSSFARMNWPDAYWKPHKDECPYWEGYFGQETVVLDDFSGSFMSLHQFQVLVDRYPLMLNLKFGSTPCLAKRIVITSNWHPTDWYQCDVGRTVLRRVQEFAKLRFVYCETLGDWFYDGTRTPWGAPEGIQVPNWDLGLPSSE